MAHLGINFNAADVEPADSFDPIPAGWYTAQIVGSEMKDTKAATGKYLSLQLDVISGPYAKRKLWDRLNLVNQNQAAVNIATRTLSSICRAVGVLQVSDSEQLHGKPLQVKVAYLTDEYGAKNEVKAYKSAQSANTGELPPVAASAATAKITPPWMR